MQRQAYLILVLSTAKWKKVQIGSLDDQISRTFDPPDRAKEETAIVPRSYIRQHRIREMASRSVL